jgi:hypothetical protein
LISPPRRLGWALLAATWLLCFLLGALKGFLPQRDGKSYLGLAHSLLAQGRYAPPERLAAGDPRPYAQYEPLQPLFLAGCEILGGRWAYLTLASACVAGAMGLWFLLLKRWAGPASWMPHLAWALLLWPNRLYLHVRHYRREPLLALMTAATVFWLVRAWDSGRRRDALLAGLCAGLAALTKSVWMLLPLFVLAAWLLGQRPLRPLAWALLAFSVSISPWVLRNRMAFGAWVPGSTLGAVGFLRNNFHNMDPWRFRFPEVHEGILPQSALDEAKAQHALYRRKLAVLAREPSLALRIPAANLLAFLYPIEGAYDPYEAGDAARLNPSLCFAYLGILLGMGAARRLPWRGDSRWPAAAALACYGVVSMLYSGAALFRPPVEALFMGWGCWGWARWTRGGSEVRRAGACAAAWALCWGARRLWTEEARRPLMAWACGLLG